MKKVLFVLVLMVGIWGRGQSIQLIPNPAGVGNVNSIIKYSNNIVTTYKNSNGKIQLAKYDGINLNLIANPDIGSISTNTFLIEYSNSIYFIYVNVNNDTSLAKYDGNIVQTINNDPNYVIHYDNTSVPYIIHNNLFLIYQVKVSRKYQLAVYNDFVGFNIFPNPTNGDGVIGGFFELNNFLFFNYRNYSTIWGYTNNQIAYLNGNTVQLINKSQANFSWDYASFTSFDTINSNIYGICSKNTIDPIPQLATIKPDTVLKVNLPSWILGGLGSGLTNLKVYKSSLILFVKNGANNVVSILKYKDTSFSPIDTTQQIRYGNNSYELKKYSSKMFGCMQNIYGTYKNMCIIDTNGTIPIANPDTTVSFYAFADTLNNKLVCRFIHNYGSYSYLIKFAIYDGQNFTMIDNPDSGKGVNCLSSVVLNNRLYFIYANINNKSQLGYIDFNILPLKLLSFTAQKENNNVLLNWQTANEVNVSHTNIQRSTNNNEFITIGKVNIGVSHYSFLDDKLPNTNDKLTLYYRLETVDKDGSKTYSEIKNIEYRTRNNELRIYPNPAKDVVTIECAGAKEILIIDYLGRTVKQINNPTQPQTINTKQWSKGVYVVQVIMKNGDVKNEKLLVE